MRFGEQFGGCLRAQGEDARHDSLYLGIGRDQSFGVHFSDWYMDSPLVYADFLQAVQRQVDAFADAHPYGAGEQERIRVQSICTSQFLLQGWILLQGERPGQMAVFRRKILATNKIWLKDMAISGEVVQQPPET